MQNGIIFCDRCGCEFTRDSVHYFEDEYFCSECLDDATVVCNHCGERIWSDDNNGTDSFPLCQRCYDNHYTTCEDCGRVIHYDDCNYLYDDDDIAYGYTVDDVEDLLYIPEGVETAVEEILCEYAYCGGEW